VEVFSGSLDEVSPSEFLSFRELVLLDLGVDHLAETFLLFFGEEGGDHTDGQDVVKEFQESLLSDVRVSEEESSRLGKHKFVKLLEI